MNAMIQHPAYIPETDDALKSLPELPRAYARALLAKCREATPLQVRTQVLSFMSSGAAPLYTVEPPQWNEMGISLFTVNLLDSGGSKSPVHDALVAALEEFQVECIARMAEAEAEHERRLEEWKADKKFWTSERSRRQKANEPWFDVTVELTRLSRTKPEPPKDRKRLATEFDLVTLVMRLCGRNEALDIITDEARGFLKSPWLKKYLDKLIRACDGKCLDYGRDKVKKKVLEANHPCVTIGLATQQFEFEPFLPVVTRNKVEQSEFEKSGAAARVLFCVTESVKDNGYAPDGTEDAPIEALKERLLDFYRRHRDNLEAGITARTKLTFGPDAELLWHDLARQVSDMKFGDKAHIEKFCSKMLKHVASLAALIHVWESDSSQITESALQRAWTIVEYHADQYEMLFAPQLPSPSSLTDINRIGEYLSNLYYQDNEGRKHVEIDRIGGLLEIDRKPLMIALFRLEHHGRLYVSTDRRTIDCSPMFSRGPRYVAQFNSPQRLGTQRPASIYLSSGKL